MISEWLGEMFEGDFAETCTETFSAGVDGGPSGGSSVCRTENKDPHQCHRNFFK